MTLRSVLATALLLSLAACAGTSRVMLSDARPPVDPATVRIYTAVPPGAIQIAQLDAAVRSASAPRARPTRWSGG